MMGMGSYRGLSLSIFCLQCLPFELLDWSVGRDVVMKAGGAVGVGCRRLGRWASRDRWLIIWTKSRGICWFGKGDRPRGCTASVSIWSSNKLVSLANRSLSFKCRARIFLRCSLWHWFELYIGLPYFLTFGNKFDIKYFTWCIAMHMMHACITQKYEMTCYCSKIPDWLWLNICTLKIRKTYL